MSWIGDGPRLGEFDASSIRHEMHTDEKMQARATRLEGEHSELA